MRWSWTAQHSVRAWKRDGKSDDEDTERSVRSVALPLGGTGSSRGSGVGSWRHGHGERRAECAVFIRGGYSGPNPRHPYRCRPSGAVRVRRRADAAGHRHGADPAVGFAHAASGRRRSRSVGRHIGRVERDSGATGDEWLHLDPSGRRDRVPATSNLNWRAGGPNIANSVTVQLPTTGTINIYVEGTIAEVLIDVAGYYTAAETVPTTPTVTMQPFEVKMSFGSTQTIAESGDMSLSLRCREDDQTPDQDFSPTNRNNMQFRAYSSGQYMTTYDAEEGLYDNEGVTIARALGSAVADTKFQTTFVTRDMVRTAAAMTGADGSQIAVDGDSVQVMFNVDNPTVTGGGDPIDCYARGVVTLLPPR